MPSKKEKEIQRRRRGGRGRGKDGSYRKDMQKADEGRRGIERDSTYVRTYVRTYSKVMTMSYYTRTYVRITHEWLACRAGSAAYGLVVRIHVVVVFLTLACNSDISYLFLRAQRLINLEIPVLVRSLKSSNVELG